MINLITTDASSSVLDVLSSQGLALPTSLESAVPSLPSDITDLDDEDLIRLFQHLTEFTKFVKVQMTCAQIDENQTKKMADTLEATLMVSTSASSGPKTTVSYVKSVVAADPQLAKLNDALQAKHDYRKMIEVMVTNLESDTNLVSRELTRRTSGANFKTRSSRFTT